MLCVTIPHEDKFINVVDRKAIGASKHIDYALFHWKAQDVKVLKLPITKFIFVDVDGSVREIIPAAQLKNHGVNYKTAKRDTTALTDDEQAEIKETLELAREFVKAATAPKTKPVNLAPAADLAKVFITPEGAAAGLQDLNKQGDASELPADVDVADTSPVDSAEAQRTEDSEYTSQAADPPEDPTETMKPSRTKKRR